MLGRLTRSPRKSFGAELAERVDQAIRAKGWKDPTVRQVVGQFHRIYYAASRRTWANTYWRGVPVLKCPLDLWVYQEILHEVRPDLIVEAGTKHGGSARMCSSSRPITSSTSSITTGS